MALNFMTFEGRYQPTKTEDSNTIFGISSFNDKVYVQGPLHAGNTTSGSVGTINQVLVSTGTGVEGKALVLQNDTNNGATEQEHFVKHKACSTQQRYIFEELCPTILHFYGVKLTDGNIQQTTAVPFILQRNFLEEILLKYMRIVPYQIGLKVLIIKT